MDMMRTLGSVVALLVVPAVAVADGVDIQHIKLSELLGSTAIALQVRAQTPAKDRRFTGQIERVWRRATTGGASPVGKSRTFELPPEPAFVPGAWIVVRQYWDLAPTAVKPGAKMVLVVDPADPGRVRAALPLSPRVAYKLRVHLAPRWQHTYRRRATVAQLRQDLADFDLYELAYDTLRARRRLTTATVLEAAAAAPHHDLLRHHLDKLAPGRRRAFLAAAARRSAVSPRLKKLVRDYFVWNKLRRDDLPALLIFLRGLDPGQKRDAQLMYELNQALLRHLESPSGKEDARRFIDHFARYIPARPDHDDSQARQFRDLLSPDRRRALCLKLLRGWRKGPPDLTVVSLVLDAAARLPPARIIEFLRRLQPHLEAGDCGGPNARVARVVVQLARQPALARKLRKLARAVHATYTCNVDSQLKARLAEVGGL